MRVYVAAKTDDLLWAQEVIRLVRTCGHEITYDWTINVKDLGPTPPPPHYSRTMAYADIGGVVDAELVIVNGHPNVCGTLIEMGAAIGASGHRDIWLVGDFPRESVFFHLPQVRRLPRTLGAIGAHLRGLK